MPYLATVPAYFICSVSVNMRVNRPVVGSATMSSRPPENKIA